MICSTGIGLTANLKHLTANSLLVEIFVPPAVDAFVRLIAGFAGRQR